jgi:pyruvate dehydrogenase E1 component alpha subunit
MRENNTPFYIEAYTYRWKGHVGHRDDIDVGVKRGDQLSYWKQRDPIKRLANSMIENNIISQKEYDALNEEVHRKIEIDWEKAEKAEFPQSNFLLKPVYSV